MRRSTAAAVGTLTGAALIIGVRLSVTPPEAPVAQAPVSNLENSTSAPSKKPAAKPTTKPAGDGGAAKEEEKEEAKAPEKPKSGLKDGVFKGNAAANPYGKIQVTIKVEGGEITAAEATYPTANDSGTINPPAIDALKQSTLQAQKAADVQAVSGATYTSESYVKSLQAALDAAKA
ncbi:FMN-binding protein [Paractinoplanes lichenicola]|uniref:FMN-binding protein n=1 Tax=Paractinoplanes lichenicola TaxID=2802976 RepID=A0ABS1VGN8_9ACTN|nr:FMN-binding protein [Actinoplanes lichenicola]MBL7253868.1 FMN-binding protein [Actinoplanes lichenicola]